MDIKNRLSEYSEYMKTALERSLGNTPEKVARPMEYSLEAGGKRIRPVLVREFAKLCGGNGENTESAMCAIEMIHTFSLIHDDLPALDNDDYRRGKPSCHKAFGEANAILAGDALSVKAFEVIATDKNISDEIKVKLINELSEATMGMIYGQFLDLEYENRKDLTEDEILEMYSGKTCRLIKCSCCMGAICAGATKEQIALATRYAECLGLVFQIVDDILDVTGTAEELGKPIGSDVQQNKTTYVTLLGLEKAKLKAEELTREALEILDEFENSGFMSELTKMLLSRKK